MKSAASAKTEIAGMSEGLLGFYVAHDRLIISTPSGGMLWKGELFISAVFFLSFVCIYVKEMHSIYYIPTDCISQLRPYRTL